ncbi:alpha-amylase [Streptococcus suis]|nr:alpha-amylase [Streptococcus suis]
MPLKNSKSIRNSIIYSVFVRNFSEEGTFKEVEDKLDNLRELGVDIIWLMPFYPIGIKKKKGRFGSPYSIRNHQEIANEYGTIEDFKKLCDAVHKNGMKIIIDIVFNHTALDSDLVKQHPEWFYKKPNGEFGNKVGDWTDIIDLDYSNRELWSYQINILKYWIENGVDGFRCDVASLIPLDFWKQARNAINEIKPDCIWLAESIDHNFIRYMRSNNLIAHSDGELYEVFDITYDYDIRHIFNSYLKNDIALSRYVEAIQMQEAIYPSDYIKMRFLENHDQPRIASLVTSKKGLLGWTAVSIFLKGCTLIYNGQEVGSEHLPNLFEKDVIDFTDSGTNLWFFLRQLIHLRDEIPEESVCELVPIDTLDILIIKYYHNNFVTMLFASLKGKTGVIDVELLDGNYINKIDGSVIAVHDNKINCRRHPIILTTNKFLKKGGK